MLAVVLHQLGAASVMNRVRFVRVSVREAGLYFGWATVWRLDGFKTGFGSGVGGGT